MSDTNVIRLYQYFREKINAGKVKYFDISLDDLKSDLVVADSEHYKEFKYFNNQFIKRSISKIIEKTEFNIIKMEVIKRISRKAVEVRISYEYNDYYS